MTAKLYAGTDANGTLLAACELIELQVDGRWNRQVYAGPDPAGEGPSISREPLLEYGLTIAASGRIEDVAYIDMLRQRSCPPSIDPYFLVYDNGGSWQGDFAVENFREGNPGGQEGRFTLRIVSELTPVYTPAP